MGVAFALHGWGKIQHAFDWMGPQASVPVVLQAAAALAEFGGGIALVFGLVTRLAALGIGSVMVGALSLVHIPRGDSFVSVGGLSFELPAVYLACAVMFLLLGPGRLSADACLFRASSAEPKPGAG